MEILKQGWIWIIFVALIVSGGILLFGDSDFFVREPVAVSVNSETMTESEFDEMKKYAEETMKMQGMTELSSEDIREKAVEMAIEQLLFLSYIEDKNIEVTDEEIEEFYDLLIEEDGGAETKEEFFAVWESEGISRREVEEQVMFAIKYEKLFDSYSEEVEITDEELQVAYDEYKQWMAEMGGEDEEVMSLAELEGELKEFALQEKVQNLINSELNELREKSTIEGSQIDHE